MPSFDVVSEFDEHEVSNAVDLANKEIKNRFDFKAVDASFELKENIIELSAEEEFQLGQMQDILRSKLSQRKVDLGCMDIKPSRSGHRQTQDIEMRQGVDRELAKKIIKQIKDAKLKVQASVQGDQVRISGKKRDDLQSVIALLKSESHDVPLQYVNFRD